MAFFTTFDLVFFIVTLLFAIVASYRGVIKELFSFFNWLIALVISYLISPFISDLLKSFFQNKLVLDIAIRAIVFLICYIAFIILTSGFLRDLSESINIYVNKILGLFFGIFKSIIIFGLVYAFYNCFFDFALGNKLSKQEEQKMPEWYYQSYSATPITFFGDFLTPFARGFIDFVVGNLSKSIDGYKLDNQKDSINKINPDNNLDEIIDKVNSSDIETNSENSSDKIIEEKKVKSPINSYNSNLNKNSSGNNNDSGYNKKDIEKMHRLIEIINN